MFLLIFHASSGKKPGRCCWFFLLERILKRRLTGMWKPASETLPGSSHERWKSMRFLLSSLMNHRGHEVPFGSSSTVANSWLSFQAFGTKNPYQGRVSSGCWWIYLGKPMETSGYFGESWVMCRDDLLLYLAVLERGSEASFSPHNLGFGPTTPCRQDCQVFSVQPGMLCVISSVVPWRLGSETSKSDLVWKYEK